MIESINDWIKTEDAGTAKSPDSTVRVQLTEQSVDSTLAESVFPDVDETAIDSDVEHRFRPLGELGRGGMSSVHDTADLHLLRRSAFKVMHADRAQEQALRNQFIIEAQITAQLEHPNIIPVYELGQDANGLPYLSLRKVGGETFRRFIQENATVRLSRSNLTRAVRVLINICDAMEYAHHRGVMHRDIKPSNILVGDFKEVYIADWGVALTGVGMDVRDPVQIRPARKSSDVPLIVGTPTYMSPEQSTGLEKDIGPHTDVFLLGATLYELLTGQPPYKGPQTIADVVALAARCGFRPPAELIPDDCRCQALERIAAKAMAQEPQERFSGMSALSEALRDFLEGVGSLTSEWHPAAKVIIEEGERGNCAYIIVTGACQVYTEQGEPGVLAELGPGQVFGEMAVLSGGRRTSSVRALTDVELQVVTREALHDALGMQTWVGPFVTALADRFKIVSRELRELKR